jgi:hypothetical protein
MRIDGKCFLINHGNNFCWLKLFILKLKIGMVGSTSKYVITVNDKRFGGSTSLVYDFQFLEYM